MSGVNSCRARHGNGTRAVVTGDFGWQRELHPVVDVPAAGTVRHRVGFGVGEQRVLRHAVAVVAQHRLGKACERLAHDQIAECVVVLEHAHQRRSAAVVAGLILLHRRVGQLALHRRAQGVHLLRLQHRSKRAVAVATEALADVRGLLCREPLPLQDRTRHGASIIPRLEPRKRRHAAAGCSDISAARDGSRHIAVWTTLRPGGTAVQRTDYGNLRPLATSRVTAARRTA